MPTEPFVIHHLTDIHIGPMHHHPTQPNWLKQYQPGTFNIDRYITHLEQNKPLIPDLVVLSGDLTSVGTNMEMNVAQDTIHHLVQVLKQKHSTWRTTSSAPKQAPYVVMVPGNHDLDWTKDTYEQKIDEFARMADGVSNSGEVLSSTYHHAEGEVYYDFGEEANLCVYLLDSTYLGGTQDYDFKNIHQQISQCQNTLVQYLQKSGLSSDAAQAQAQVSDALKQLEKASRKDPGYVTPDAIDKMRATLATIAPTRLKLAVLHHNPTTVPSDDVDQFDVLINAARLKQEFSRSGFDVALYGHRHFFHCSYESLPSRSHLADAELGSGLLLVAGDSLGCKQEGPFLELSIGDLPAHKSVPPVCLLSVYTWRNTEGDYRRDPEPAVQSILSTPIHQALDRVARNLGRSEPLPNDRPHLEKAIAIVLPPIEELRSRMVDWGSDTDWIKYFHGQMEQFYQGIYATDLSYERASAENSLFTTYVREQYVARRKRLQKQADNKLRFSHAVYETITRTNWQPSDLYYKDFTIGESDDPRQWGLEIVRIMIRPLGGMTDQDYCVLRNLDFDHRLFAIPLFIIDPGELDTNRCVDLAVAVDTNGLVMRGYAYSSEEKKVRETPDQEKRDELFKVFHDILAHPKLRTVSAFLKAAKPDMKLF